MKKQSGFAPIILILIIAGVLAASGGVYYAQKRGLIKGFFDKEKKEETAGKSGSEKSNAQSFSKIDELAKIENWIKNNNFNQYGDAIDTAYTGGTPLFDEKTGRTISLYDYLLAKHPDKPWLKEESAPAVQKETGYINNIYGSGGKNYLIIDYIQWLTGNDAIKAAKEDGEEAPPNGFYIRNQSNQLRTLEVSDTAEILTYSHVAANDENGYEQLSFNDFRDLINGTKIPPYVPAGSIYENSYKGVPFHIEITNGAITKITEQYIP
jgi:hypothetical protein